jgi:hypothetical protein
MAPRTSPPFRADHVGGLLRPPAPARQLHRSGQSSSWAAKRSATAR